MTETVINDTQRDVLAGIRKGAPLIEIGVALGYSKQYISQVVQRLAAAGLVAPAGRGRYIVTDEPGEYRRRPERIRAMLLSSEDAISDAAVWLTDQGYAVSKVRADDSEAVIGVQFSAPGKTKKDLANLGEWLILKDGKFATLGREAFAALYEGAAL